MFAVELLLTVTVGGELNAGGLYPGVVGGGRRWD